MLRPKGLTMQQYFQGMLARCDRGWSAPWLAFCLVCKMHGGRGVRVVSTAACGEVHAGVTQNVSFLDLYFSTTCELRDITVSERVIG